MARTRQVGDNRSAAPSNLQLHDVTQSQSRNERCGRSDGDAAAARDGGRATSVDESNPYNRDCSNRDFSREVEARSRSNVGYGSNSNSNFHNNQSIHRRDDSQSNRQRGSWHNDRHQSRNNNRYPANQHSNYQPQSNYSRGECTRDQGQSQGYRYEYDRRRGDSRNADRADRHNNSQWSGRGNDYYRQDYSRDYNRHGGGRGHHRKPGHPHNPSLGSHKRDTNFHNPQQHRPSPPKRHKHEMDELRAETNELKAEKERNNLKLELLAQEMQIAEKQQQLQQLKNQSVPTKTEETARDNNTPAVSAAKDAESDDDLFSASSNSPQDEDSSFAPPKPAPEAKSKQKNSKPKSKKRKKRKQVEPTEDIQATYSENNLTSYKPMIIDHCITNKKFLVRWDRSDDSFAESRCTSWVAFESFVFPGLAQQYISQVIKSKNCCNEEKSMLTEWSVEFGNTENDDKWNNTIDLEKGEGADLAEIDFCCFLCKCEHSSKEVRNCEFARKFHRACCHDYSNGEEMEGFVSAAGKAQMNFLGLSEDEEACDEGCPPNGTMVDERDSTKPRAVQVHTGKSLTGGDQQTTEPHAAVVLSINSGISTAVALKQLGINVKTIIHLEEDEVAQHVIRYIHDFKFGEADLDDGIEHIVGLYDNLDELMGDPSALVKRFGAIDLIICSSSSQTDLGHNNYTKRFVSFCREVKMWNIELKQHKSLKYFIKTTDHDCTDEQSFCVCDDKCSFICNWSLETVSLALKKLGSSSAVVNPPDDIESALGLPNKSVISAVNALFEELKKALTVGFSGTKWSETVHPKHWNFLSLGPQGYDFNVVKSKPDDSLIDSMQLRLRERLSFELLSDVEYARELLKRSVSVHWLVAILTPIVGYFENRQYAGYSGLDVVSETINTNNTHQKHDHSAYNTGIGVLEETTEDTSNNISSTNQDQVAALQAVAVKTEQSGGESTDEERLIEAFGDTRPLQFDI